MAQAVKRLYPETKLAIGPSIKDGFYYDVDRETPFTGEDLEKIEAEMKKIVKEGLRLERFTMTREEAIRFMQEKERPYKVQLIEDLPEDAELSFYRQGEFVDLCAGPHLMNTKPVKAFKLTSLAGAYWRGNEKNKMLTRIYGTAFTKKADLEEYLGRIEEAKKRDHRKLGRELGIFMMREEGPGFPLLPAEGNGSEKYAAGLLERDPQQSRLCRDFHSDHAEPSAVGNLRSLGSLQREHVHHRHR